MVTTGLNETVTGAGGIRPAAGIVFLIVRSGGAQKG
jgi:hypothetical protein